MIQLALTKGFGFALSENAAAAMLEEQLILLPLLSVSSIASSSITSAVKSGKEVKTRTGTSVQCGNGVMVGASVSQSVDLGSVSLVESYQKTLKNGIHSFPAWRSAKLG